MTKEDVINKFSKTLDEYYQIEIGSPMNENLTEILRTTIDEANRAETPVMPKIADYWQNIMPDYPCKFVGRKKENGYTNYKLYEIDIEEGRLCLCDIAREDWIDLGELDAEDYLIIERTY